MSLEQHHSYEAANEASHDESIVSQVFNEGDETPEVQMEEIENIERQIVSDQVINTGYGEVRVGEVTLRFNDRTGIIEAHTRELVPGSITRENGVMRLRTDHYNDIIEDASDDQIELFNRAQEQARFGADVITIDGQDISIRNRMPSRIELTDGTLIYHAGQDSLDNDMRMSPKVYDPERRIIVTTFLSEDSTRAYFNAYSVSGNIDELMSIGARYGNYGLTAVDGIEISARYEGEQSQDELGAIYNRAMYDAGLNMFVVTPDITEARVELENANREVEEAGEAYRNALIRQRNAQQALETLEN